VAPKAESIKSGGTMSQLNYPKDRTENGVGLAALLVGIAAIAFCTSSSTHFLAAALSVAGIILGIIGLNLQDRQRGQAVWGLVLASIALFISSGLFSPSVSISAQTESASKPAASSVSPTVSQEPAAARGTITYSGTGELNTAKQQLNGDYQASFETMGDCYYSGKLKGAGTADLPTVDEAGTVISNFYDISPGDYFVDMITGPSPGCGWSLTLTPTD
jgi:hypothetical protein